MPNIKNQTSKRKREKLMRLFKRRNKTSSRSPPPSTSSPPQPSSSSSSSSSSTQRSGNNGENNKEHPQSQNENQQKSHPLSDINSNENKKDQDQSSSNSNPNLNTETNLNNNNTYNSDNNNNNNNNDIKSNNSLSSNEKSEKSKRKSQKKKRKNPLRILTPKKLQRNKNNTTTPTTTTTNSSNTSKSPGTPLDHHNIDVEELYESSERVVANKVKESRVYSKRFEDDEEGLYIFSRNLSSKESLLHSYLTTRWVQTVELMKNVEKDVHIKKNRSNSLFSSQPESAPTSTAEHTTSTTEPNTKEEDAFDEDPSDISDGQIEQLMKTQVQRSELKNHVKVKLVITEINNTQFSRSLRKAISPILSHFEVFPEMGMFHSALVVGPWYLEWNNSSLVVPRQCISRAAIISADINTIKTINDIHETAEKLAQVVVKWNTSMKYTNRSGSFDSGTGNCQDFVEDVLSNLGLQTSFQGALGRFLSQLRQKGRCDMEFNMDPDFREKFSLHQHNIIFNSHVEVDNFVRDLISKDPLFDRNYPDEWALLKSFDRAFWLRHFRFPHEEKYTPAFHEDDENEEFFDRDFEWDEYIEPEPEIGCPFGNPEITSHWHGT